MREEARLREADDADSHHIAVAKFMQKVLLVTNKLLRPTPLGRKGTGITLQCWTGLVK